jgi:predicted ribosomally synthesized peptide with nif11-like leader
MSVKSAQEFVQKAKSDPDFFKKAVSFKTKEERREWAKTQGFDFSKEELEQASSELSDDELELVAGGKCCGYTCEKEVDPNCIDPNCLVDVKDSWKYNQ